MLADLEALTPPLIMCVAFLAGVVWFLRRQMAPAQPDDATDEADKSSDDNSGSDEDEVTGAESAPATSSDPRHS